MIELQGQTHIDAMTNTIGVLAERAKVEIESRLNPRFLVGCIGGMAMVSSAAHLMEKNYIRAAAWGGLGMYHLGQIPTQSPEL